MLSSLMHNFSYSTTNLTAKEAVDSPNSQNVELNSAFLQAVIDGLTNPIMVVGLDYQVMLLNRAAREALPQFNRKTPLLCYQISHQCEKPCSGLDHPCPLREVMRSKQTAKVVHKHTGTGGEPYFVEIQATPLLGADGSMVGIIESWHDITEHKQAIAARDKFRQALEALESITAVGVWQFDIETLLQRSIECMVEVTEANAGAILLLEPNKNELQVAASCGITERYLPYFQVPVGEGFIGQITQQEVSQMMLDTLTEEETLAPYIQNQGIKAMLGIPLKIQDKVIGAAYIDTLTEHVFGPNEIHRFEVMADRVAMTIENGRLAQEAAEVKLLRRLDHLRTELLANVSHEIRTPLGLIKLFVTTLLREDVGFEPETHREFLADIDAEVDKLDALVNNILNLSPLEGTEKPRIMALPTDISLLAHQVLDMTRKQSPNYQVFLDFPPQPLIVEVDAKRIEQVLRNLLHNAVKYSPSGSTITLTGRKLPQEDKVLISVQDQGIGISPDELEKIFSRFYRVDHPAVQQAGGVGLGLAVCRQIVSSHQGEIWAESQEREGTTFFFTLPLAQQQLGDRKS